MPTVRLQVQSVIPHRGASGGPVHERVSVPSVAMGEGHYRGGRKPGSEKREGQQMVNQYPRVIQIMWPSSIPSLSLRPCNFSSPFPRNEEKGKRKRNETPLA